MKKTLFILCALLLTAVGASAQAITSGTYMLQNVETGYYLGSGCTWGTQASLIKQPQQFTLTESNSAYTLESYVYNGATDANKLGTNLYVDGTEAASWTITQQSNGAYALYNTTVGYLAGNGKDAPVEGETSITSATYWNLITKEDIVASQASATSASPVDVTGLINNPSLNKNSQTTYGTAYWSTTGTVNIGYTNAGGDTKSYGNVAEGYHVGFSMYQTLSDLTPGIYMLSAQGFHRDDDSQASYTAPVMYVGELTSSIPSMTSASGTCTQKGSSGQSMADAQQDFLSGLYPITPIQFTVDDTNTSVEFGFKGTDEHEWVIWGDLELMYYGTELAYTIGEPECALDGKYVQPGNEVSITFNCTTPNSDDPVLDSSKSIMVNGTEVNASLTYSGTTATVTFILPSTIEYGTTVTVTVPAGLLSWSEQGVSSPASATTFTLYTPIMADQMGVYLKNLYGGDLLSRGKDYGTRADVDFVGLPVNLILQDDGRYVIQYADVDPNEASDNYLYGTAWAWADGDYSNDVRIPTSFTVTEYSDGNGNTGYHFTSDYGYLYRYDADDAYSASDYEDDYSLAVNGIHSPASGYNFTYDTQAMWTIVSIEERDAIKAQWVADQKVAVAKEAGITVTSGDDFDKYVASLTETLVESDTMESNTDSNWNTTGSFTTNGVEAYETVLRLNRTIEGLEKGIYKVTLNGFERHADNAYCWQMYQDGYTDVSNSYLVAGDYEINLKAWGTAATNDSGYNPNGMSDAKALLDEGKYLNELYTYVGDDGSLAINISLLTYDTWGWAIVKNFSLYKLEQTETTISWEMTDAGWGTLILPFDDDVPSELVAYTIASVEEDNDDDDIAATLSLTDAGNTIKANTPYIMGVADGATDYAKTYTFKGTPTNKQNSYTSEDGMLTGTFVDMDYNDFTHDSTQYLLQNHNGDVAFYPVVDTSSAAATLTPYHCYLTYSTNGASPTRLVIGFAGTDGETTAIKAIEGEEAETDGAIYDLSGRKVSKAVKGVYIQNGKKVLVK